MSARAALKYQNTFLETASPTKLLDELFGRLLRDIADAKAGIAKRDLCVKGERISHAQSIVFELRNALDFSVAPDMCSELHRLYEFVFERLTQANIAIDAKPLDEATRIVEILRDAFRGAARQL